MDYFCGVDDGAGAVFWLRLHSVVTRHRDRRPAVSGADDTDLIGLKWFQHAG